MKRFLIEFAQFLGLIVVPAVTFAVAVVCFKLNNELLTIMGLGEVQATAEVISGLSGFAAIVAMICYMGKY